MATKRETLKWNGSMEGLKLRVVQMLVQGIRRDDGKIMCWDVWGADGIALATGRVPSIPSGDGTEDEAAMVKHGARIAKAVGRALTLQAVTP